MRRARSPWPPSFPRSRSRRSLSASACARSSRRSRGGGLSLSRREEPRRFKACALESSPRARLWQPRTPWPAHSGPGSASRSAFMRATLPPRAAAAAFLRASASRWLLPSPRPFSLPCAASRPLPARVGAGLLGLLPFHRSDFSGGFSSRGGRGVGHGAPMPGGGFCSSPRAGRGPQPRRLLRPPWRRALHQAFRRRGRWPCPALGLLVGLGLGGLGLASP